ncbi:uncharacterized protein LOC129107946 [Anoplopoma fimbria]|uniref:uncharacterized protein LOC129107946 n=1 Tax=Anoplopoma fimbria TaxID=229290 RepID=UPI0023EDB600|nr:uncharacterized protein LOC129107946 [Anoplopoma fimbria]
MSKVQTLRDLVTRRQSAAAEEILELFQRTRAESRDLCYSTEEVHRHKLMAEELTASAFSLGLEVHHLIFSEQVPCEQQEWSLSVNNEDPKLPHIKEEQEEFRCGHEGEQLQRPEEADINKFPFTAVTVKSEDEVENARSSQLQQRQKDQQMKKEADEDCGRPEPARRLRVLVKQRLTAAVEEIFGMFETMLAEYKEEIQGLHKLLEGSVKSDDEVNKAETTCLPSPPLLSSPTSAPSGPYVWRVFVLDHKRWPAPMKAAIDDLLNKHRGQKDTLNLVDRDYAALVYDSLTDPSSMLHPTTELHISQYVKDGQEKLHERQELWCSLKEESETTSLPVVPTPVAVNLPLQANIEEIVQDLVEKQTPMQKKKQTPMQKKTQTKTCLSCGQPKSRHENDGSSIHFFYQQGPVRYFYCSTKVFKAYGTEGLRNPKMPFNDFAETPFFQRELDATKQRVEEKGQQKRKRTDLQPAGRRCRFCNMQLKQGPNSPHIHTGFPGVSGKYIYCPAKVCSLYKDRGMKKKMTWKEFQG